MQLDGKTAIVTGAASGFGAGIARAFTREGAQVLVAARDEQTEQIATKRIESLGGTIVVNDGGQVSVDFNIYDE